MVTTTLSCIRRPAVAGYYYPEEPEALRQAICQLIQRQPEASSVAPRAIMVPHGSLQQSGAVSAAVFGRLRVPRRCVLVGPSHTNSAMRWAVFAEGSYRTPLGDVEVDAGIAAALLERCVWLERDAWAHRGEHALEVILPFLQWARPEGFSIVPVVTSSDVLSECADVGQALAEVLGPLGEDVLLIASSDLSQYEAAQAGAAKDRRLLARILALDAQGLLRAVQEEPALMCGAGAVACVLIAARRLGATRADLLQYDTSLNVGGDPHSVIGYAGVALS